MIVYKLEDRYDQKTGKKTGSHRVYDKIICDFSGKVAEYSEDLGSSYEVNYDSSDPCFGCRDDEFELAKDFKFDIYELYGPSFIFDENSFNHGETDKPIIQEMMETYEKETGEKVQFFDQFFRWSRVRMVRELLESKKFTLDELGIDTHPDDEDED